MSIIAATFLSIWNRDFSSASTLLFRGRGKDEENQTRLAQFLVLSFSQEIPHPVHLSSFFFFWLKCICRVTTGFSFCFPVFSCPSQGMFCFYTKKKKRKKVSFVIDWTSPWVCFGEIDGQLLIIQSCIEVGQWVPGEVTAEVIMPEFFQYNIQAWKRENSFLVTEHFIFIR